MQGCHNNTVWNGTNNVNEFPNSGDGRGRLINTAVMMALSFTEIIVIWFIALPISCWASVLVYYLLLLLLYEKVLKRNVCQVLNL